MPPTLVIPVIVPPEIQSVISGYPPALSLLIIYHLSGNTTYIIVSRHLSAVGAARYCRLYLHIPCDTAYVIGTYYIFFIEAICNIYTYTVADDSSDRITSFSIYQTSVHATCYIIAFKTSAASCDTAKSTFIACC